jgi:hypothetical protein
MKPIINSMEFRAGFLSMAFFQAVFMLVFAAFA